MSELLSYAIASVTGSCYGCSAVRHLNWSIIAKVLS